MDAGDWISLGSVVVALSAAAVAWSSRSIAKAAKDEAVAANHRADAPRIDLTCDGKYGTSFGLVVSIESDRDLDSMAIDLVDASVDGKRGGFNGLWVDVGENLPMTATCRDNGSVTLDDVRAGAPCVVVAKAYGNEVPKQAELWFRLTCVSGDRPPWVVAARTGPIDVHFSMT